MSIYYCESCGTTHDNDYTPVGENGNCEEEEQ